MSEPGQRPTPGEQPDAAGWSAGGSDRGPGDARDHPAGSPPAPNPWSREGSGFGPPQPPADRYDPGVVPPYPGTPASADPGYGTNPYEPSPYGLSPYAGGPAAWSPYGLPPEPHPKSTTAMVLGIVGVVLCPFVGIGGLVMGRRVRQEIDAEPQRYSGRGPATAGYVLGIISVVYSVLVVLYVIFFAFLLASGNLD